MSQSQWEVRWWYIVNYAANASFSSFASDCFDGFLSSAAASIHRSLKPDTRRNFSSAETRLAATQRRIIAPPSHSVTRRVRIRIPEFGLSMMLVETRLRRNEAGTPRRFTVNISAIPSRRLPAAPGYSLSYCFASVSSRRSPFAASRVNAARIVRRA